MVISSGFLLSPRLYRFVADIRAHAMLGGKFVGQMRLTQTLCC
jgi:hypothetical protein